LQPEWAMQDGIAKKKRSIKQLYDISKSNTWPGRLWNDRLGAQPFRNY
jgi:hypothetical protein